MRALYLGGNWGSRKRRAGMAAFEPDQRRPARNLLSLFWERPRDGLFPYLLSPEN